MASSTASVFERPRKMVHLPPCLEAGITREKGDEGKQKWITAFIVYLKENGFGIDEIRSVIPIYTGSETTDDGLVQRAYARNRISCDELRAVCIGCDSKSCRRKAPRHYFDGRAINSKYVADEIMEDFHIATIIESGIAGGNTEIYIYEEGYYKARGGDWPSGEAFLRQEIQRRLHASWKGAKANEIMKYIKDKTAVSYSIFDADPNILNLKNGLFNIRTGELSPHNCGYYSRRRIPISYNPDAKCPETLKFYNIVLQDEDTQYSILQFIGYCLYNGMPIQRAFLLVGEPNSGKGTLLRQIRTALGKENCCSIPLQLLEANQFATTTLTSKLANIYGDMSPVEMPSVETFRMLIGDDLIRGEYKGGSDIYFQNTCKFIFAANTTPKVRDSSDAYYRRWYIIPFGNRIPDDQIDINLTAKITTDEELSGLFNLVIPALRTLLAEGHFRNQPSVDESREMYEKASDPIMAFIDDMLEPALGEKVAKDEVYKSFLTYCKLYRLQTYGSDTFNRLFADKASKIGASHVKKADFGREGGRRIQKPGWRDIRFIPEETAYEEVDLR